MIHGYLYIFKQHEPYCKTIMKVGLQTLIEAIMVNYLFYHESPHNYPRMVEVCAILLIMKDEAINSLNSKCHL